MLNKYVQELNLSSYDVFHECDPYKPMFFDIGGIMGETLGYGKHGFTISILNPENNQNLYFKDNSNVIFEAIDSAGTDITHVNGSSFGFIYIQEDLKDTYNEIANGNAKLIIVGELAGNGLPKKWRGTYNIRTQILFIIRKNQPNHSNILFENEPTVRVSQSYESYGDAPLSALQTNTSHRFHIHEFDNLNTIAGDVKFINIAYKLSSSADVTEQFTEVDTFEVTSSSELLTNNISKSEGSKWIGNFTDLTQWETGSQSNDLAGMFADVGTELRSLSNFAYHLQYGHFSPVGGVHISGEQSIGKVVRKTVNDEQFKLKLNYTGSGGYAIIASKYLDRIDDTHQNFRDTDLKLDNRTIILQKLFPTASSGQRLGPEIDGVIYPNLDGNYDEVSFTVPANHYFAVRLIANQGKTASFNDVRIWPNPPQGVNSPIYYYKTLTPDMDYERDVIYYRYKFLNSNHEIAKNYTKYPVSDYTLSSSMTEALFTKYLAREQGINALRIRSHQTKYKSSAAIVAEAVGSGSDNVTGSFGSPVGVNTIYSKATIADDVDYSDSGVTALQTYTKTTTGHADNTGSAWSAYFNGDTGAGDVLIKQNLGIGDFTYPNEHPSASLHVKGDIIAENYIVKSSVTEMTTSYMSGSTKWGDSADDTHVFSGSMLLSSINPNFSFMKPASGIAGIYFKDSTADETDADIYLDGAEELYIRTRNDGGRIIFQAMDNTQLVLSGSNVGVGTVSPPSDTTLTVSGSISASGDLNIEGSVVMGDVSASELHIAKTSAAADELIFTIREDGNLKFSVDEDGDMYVNGNSTFNTAVYVDTTIGGSIADSNTTSYISWQTADYAKHYANSEQLLTLYGGTAGSGPNVTIGDGGDVNFKVRSNGDDYAIWVDGGEDKVGIGTNTPTKKLQVDGTISASGDLIIGDLNSNFISMSRTGRISASGTVHGLPGNIYTDTVNLDSLEATTNTNVLMTINNQGFTFEAEDNDSFKFNTGYANVDFQYYNGNEDIFFEIDASTSRIQVGELGGTAENTLDVVGSFRATGPITASKIIASNYVSGALASSCSFGHGFIKNKLGIGALSPSRELQVAGTVGVANYIYHNGDDDTYYLMEDDKINLVAGGKSMIKLDYGGTNDKVLINNTNADIDFWVNSNDGEAYLFGDANNKRFGINTNPSAGDQLPEALTVEGNISSSGDFYLESGKKIYFADTDQFIHGNGAVLYIDGDNYTHIYGDNAITLNSPYVAVNRSTAGSEALTVESDISASGNLIVASDISSSMLFVSSSGNVMINTDLTGSVVNHKGAFSVNYGNATQLTGSLTADGIGYGDIVKFGGTTGLVPGSIVYLKSNGSWALADATGGNAAAACSSSLLGVAMGGNSDVDGILLRGIVEAASVANQSTGQKLYLVANANGRFGGTVPSTSGNIVRVVGYSLTTGDEVYFNPDNTWVTIS